MKDALYSNEDLPVIFFKKKLLILYLQDNPKMDEADNLRAETEKL